MTKLYKIYSNACRFTHSLVEAVTLDNVKGFMPKYSLRPVREIKHDTATWADDFKRHFVTAELPEGLFGHYCFDTIGNAEPIQQPFAQTLFSTEKAALEAHRSTVERYRKDPLWQA